MLCPVCRQPLVIVEYRQIELDACPDCRGLWFDAQELQQLFELVGASDRFQALEDQLDRLSRANPRRKCPRCRGPLSPVKAPTATSDLILDECPREHGIWFDPGELDALLRSALGNDGRSLQDVQAYLGRFVAPAGSDSQ